MWGAGWLLPVIALVILLSGVLLGLLISLDPTAGSDAIWITTWVTLGLNLLWWLPAMLLSRLCRYINPGLLHENVQIAYAAQVPAQLP